MSENNPKLLEQIAEIIKAKGDCRRTGPQLPDGMRQSRRVWATQRSCMTFLTVVGMRDEVENVVEAVRA